MANAKWGKLSSSSFKENITQFFIVCEGTEQLVSGFQNWAINCVRHKKRITLAQVHQLVVKNVSRNMTYNTQRDTWCMLFTVQK